MNFGTIKNVLTSKAGRQLLQLQKHSPRILFVAGVVGVVGTVVLASRATLKLDDVLDEHSATLEKIDLAADSIVTYTAEDARKDQLVLYTKTAMNIAKLYAPAVVVGIASVAALTGSHIVLSNRVTGLTAAYTALDKAFRTYRERVIAEVGEEKEKDIRDGAFDREYVKETEEGPVVTTEKRRLGGKSPYARIFDEVTSTNWEPNWQFNQMFLRTQQNYMNDLLRSRGHVMLNEVYDALGMERSKEGFVVGWVLDGGASDNFIDFGIFDHSNLHEGLRFINGDDRSVWLDFNVDGVVYDKI